MSQCEFFEHILLSKLDRQLPVEQVVDGAGGGIASLITGNLIISSEFQNTPGLHNKILAHKIFARVWVAQGSFFS